MNGLLARAVYKGCRLRAFTPAASLLVSSHPTFVQKRSFFILPFGLDVGIVGAVAYNVTKVKRPDERNELSVFGPLAGTKECELYPDRVVRCIAHRGAGSDAPENTIEAFKYCVENNCKFIEFDVRTSKDGKLVLLHDEGLVRLAGSSISDVKIMDWDSIKDINICTNHPKIHKFREARLCLLDEALDYLMSKDVRMIIDLKGEDKPLIESILRVFRIRQDLYEKAAITSFNPFVLYQIRRQDPEIVTALNYRPYGFSALDWNAEKGPIDLKNDRLFHYAGFRLLDFVYGNLWRMVASWVGVSAVLLHKDLISRQEIQYWKERDVRCLSWCVDSPLEKVYWSGVLKVPYLANTLVGEPAIREAGAEASDEDKLTNKLAASPERRTERVLE